MSTYYTLKDGMRKETQIDPVAEGVYLFNTQGKQLVRHTPEFIIPEKQLRFDLISEELTELKDAFKDLDFVEVIDACADVVYVAAGAALSHGIAHQVTFNRATSVYETSFEKDGMIREMFMTKIDALLYELYTVENTRGLRTSLENIIEFCYLVASSYSVVLDTIIEEVQASNMSKFLEDGTALLNEAGKIQKGPNYFKPNIPQILTNAGLDFLPPLSRRDLAEVF